jgi:hypothetical protein
LPILQDRGLLSPFSVLQCCQQGQPPEIAASGVAKHSPKPRASAVTRSFIVIPFVTPATPQILPQKAGNALARPQNRCPHRDI